MLPVTCYLQVKPFISEAHVFNDAGLSFDVWPPRTGTPASDTPPKPIPIGLASDTADLSDPASCQSSVHDDWDNKAEICLTDMDFAADKPGCSAASGKCMDATRSASQDDAVTTSQSKAGFELKAAASNMVGPDVGMSRGYLLAFKLWEEAVATVKSAQE